ncbi:TerC family protein [Anaerobacillus sp. MEB173]|uniref:TerC family protein n=1 Tax=Anaerobacillus sp. MEB173 TaxID=3383345 RepID=UPI003F91246A
MNAELDFIIPLLTIIGIDIVLGGDNAIVVALACRNLPQHLRNKAIILGISLAIITRMLLTVIAVYILQIPYLLAFGGAMLLFIAYSLVVEKNDTTEIEGKTSLAAAIKTIVIADLVMGFDNVIAVAGAANGNIILVVIGLIISVPIIIWGSKLILGIMESYPFVVYIGAGILSFTAGRMITEEDQLSALFSNHPFLTIGVQVALIIAVLFSGWLANKRFIKRISL